MAEYLEALYRELSFVTSGMRELGMYAESVYIGGGTPTALPAPMLEELLARVAEGIPCRQASLPAPMPEELLARVAEGIPCRQASLPATVPEELLARVAEGIPCRQASLPAPMPEELLVRVAEGSPRRPAAMCANGLGALRAVAEFTVEAGRPDTITYEKATLMARAGARVSVNPQTMNEITLKRIGRAHTAADVKTAFELVRAAGVKLVNADVIAGLPGEGLPDFVHTLEEVMRMGAENITIHTLALKKGSAMREHDGTDYYYDDGPGGGAAAEMLGAADGMLTARGMGPYYLYRQKQTVGNLENVGYAAAGAECVYNMRMMQERQAVIALGAGAVSKLYFREEDRIERVFNVADAGLYIARIDEMIERKRGFFENA